MSRADVSPVASLAPEVSPVAPLAPEVSPVAPLAPVCTDYAAVTDLRAADPGAVARAWDTRTTRPTIRGDGRLMIVAADHPARGALPLATAPPR